MKLCTVGVCVSLPLAIFFERPCEELSLPFWHFLAVLAFSSIYKGIQAQGHFWFRHMISDKTTDSTELPDSLVLCSTGNLVSHPLLNNPDIDATIFLVTTDWKQVNPTVRSSVVLGHFFFFKTCKSDP